MDLVLNNKFRYSYIVTVVNLLERKRRLLYLKTHFIPRCKHFSSRL